MPTPFYHIDLAERIIVDPGLTSLVSNHLHKYSSEFLFGNVAPDYQALSQHSRTTSHFYSINNTSSEIAYKNMLLTHTSLSNVKRMSDRHSAFVAGYLAHLLVDQQWKFEVFDPVFGQYQTWENFQERMFLHNVLRIYLDGISYQCLPPDICRRFSLDLSSVDWLPFASNVDLERWYNFIYEQLMDGSSPKTLEVFSSRMNRNTDDFYEILASQELLEEHIFSRISIEYLDEFCDHVSKKVINMLNYYFDT